MDHLHKIIVTYQCAAMKIDILQAFSRVKHRLCMCHIIKKIPENVTSLHTFVSISKLYNIYILFLNILLHRDNNSFCDCQLGPLFWAESKFIEKLNRFVWSDHSSPIEFEKGWKVVSNEFELLHSVWLYEMCSSWIPVYFNDDLMAGLLEEYFQIRQFNFLFQSLCAKW